MDDDSLQSASPDTPPTVDPGVLATLGGGDAQQPTPTPQLLSPAAAANTVESIASGAHHSVLARARDAVANLLGGSKTVHITRHPDGSTEITHDPSTGSEKWGRIAAAALSGAAKGWAAGQGPGGAGRAAGAGFDAGMEAQKAPEQEAERQQDRANKQLQDKANLVLTQQRLAGQLFANKQNELKASDEEIQQADDESNRYGNSPNSISVGTFANMHEAATSPNAKLILQNHPNATLRIVPAHEGGKSVGVRAYVVDKAWGDRINSEPATFLEQDASGDPNDPNAPPTFKRMTIPINSDSNDKVDTKVAAKNLAHQKTMADWY